MNHFKLLFAGVMCIFSTIPILRGQTTSEQSSMLTVSYLTGSEVQYALSTIGKLSFSTDSVFLISTSNEVLGRDAKEKVRALLFTSKISASMSMADTNTVHVFPNPTADALQIVGIKVIHHYAYILRMGICCTLLLLTMGVLCYPFHSCREEHICCKLIHK